MNKKIVIGLTALTMVSYLVINGLINVRYTLKKCERFRVNAPKSRLIWLGFYKGVKYSITKPVEDIKRILFE